MTECRFVMERRLADLPKMTPVQQWKKVTWSNESRFLLHPADDLVSVCCIPGEVMAPGCPVRQRQQAREGSVMLWAMFCLETQGPTLHVDMNLTYAIYLNVVANPLLDNGVPWWKVPLSAG